MAEGVAGGLLDDSCLAGGLSDGALDDGFVEVVAAALVRLALAVEAGGGEGPLPAWTAAGQGVLAVQGAGELDPSGSRAQVRLVLGQGVLDLVLEGWTCDLGLESAAVLVALARADDQVAGGEVDVLDPQVQGLEETQAGAVEQGGDRLRRAVQALKQEADLVSAEDHWQALRALRADESVEPRKVDVEDVAVQEEERGQGLVLGGCADPAAGREVAEEGGDFPGAEVEGMAPAVVLTSKSLSFRKEFGDVSTTRGHQAAPAAERPWRRRHPWRALMRAKPWVAAEGRAREGQEAADPVQIGLLGPRAQVPDPDGGVETLVQDRSPDSGRGAWPEVVGPRASARRDRAGVVWTGRHGELRGTDLAGAPW